MPCSDYNETPSPVTLTPSEKAWALESARQEKVREGESFQAYKRVPRGTGLKAVKKQIAEQKEKTKALEARLAELQEADRKRPRKKKTSSILEESPASPPRRSYKPSRGAC